MSDIDELRKLLAEATPGPWHAGGREVWLGTVPTDSRTIVRDPVDAQLIVALRNAAPALLDEIERLRKIEAASRSTAKWAREFCTDRGCEGGTPDGSCPDYKECVDDWCDPCRVWRAVEALDRALAEGRTV